MSDENSPTDKKPWKQASQERTWEFVVPVLFMNGLGAFVSLVLPSAPGGPSPMLFYLALVVPAPFAIGSLLAMWAAFGGRSGPWRLLLVLVPPAVVASAIVSRRLPADDPGMWVVALLFQAAATSLVMLALRLGGARIARPDSSSGPLPPRFQFSLRLLLEWTCAIAVLSATVSLFPRDALADLTRNGKELFRTVLLLAFNGFLAAAALGLTFTPRQSGPWFFWLAMGIVVGMAVLAAMGAGEAIPEVGMIWGCQAGWMVGSLWPFRRAGFRLTWGRAATPDGELPGS